MNQPKQYWVKKLKTEIVVSILTVLLGITATAFAHQNDLEGFYYVIAVAGLFSCIAFAYITITALDSYWILREYKTNTRWPDSQSKTFTYKLEHNSFLSNRILPPTFLVMIILAALPLAIAIVLVKI